MISTTPIDVDMIVAVVGLCFGTRDRTQMVSTVAGTDPAAKSPATPPSTLPFLEWIAGPARFLTAAPAPAQVPFTVLGGERGASRFPHGGVEKVGSHRRERMDPEKQYQQRRHQRTATHAGQTHDGADNKTRERIEPVHGLVQHGPSGFFQSTAGSINTPSRGDNCIRLLRPSTGSVENKQ